jgi:hypothetical protein
LFSTSTIYKATVTEWRGIGLENTDDLRYDKADIFMRLAMRNRAKIRQKRMTGAHALNKENGIAKWSRSFFEVS